MVTPEPSHSVTVAAESGTGHLIRSEERLDVRTDRVVGEWVRLEKYLVTETRTVTVELTHEEIRLVREPADPDGTTTRGVADGKNAARWMYVNREELVITKTLVPVERVRLEVFPVTEHRQFTETVRKEQITDAFITSTDVPVDSPQPGS